ncbi:hypothetical protein BCR32DRAFT_284274 [Anaeromyces robustus]|uniref:Uncharacterized protein n=1 Tax=Anaeromyces robustus TaxID=1754192 RepID=A0A1Y1WSC5_9FUNG|nr:hypothetical protein BCR32DRAFT_284274 [Anaeromyces robustus]|eukprot:ORX76352.1 hypothetical protein BCR32DRAFT_284274 [Anaeromyces robustus]
MENFKKNRDILEYIIKTNSLETCHNNIRFPNNVETTNIIKSIINSKKLSISLDTEDTESYENNHDYITKERWDIKLANYMVSQGINNDINDLKKRSSINLIKFEDINDTYKNKLINNQTKKIDK